MKSFAVLFIKDLRAVRGWIAALWAPLVMMLLCPQIGRIGESDFSWPWVASCLSTVSCFILIFMQRALLKVDPPNGAERFIATRPVRGEAVFLSKLATILAGGILPVCLAAAMRLSAAGLEFTWLDAGTLSLGNAWMLLSLLGLLSLRHVIPGHSFWITLFGGAVALVMLLVTSASMADSSLHDPWDWIFAALTMLGFPCWAGLASRYGRWRGWLRMLVIPGTWLAVTWASVLWQRGVPPSPETVSKSTLGPLADPHLTCSQYLPWSNAFAIHSVVTATGLPPGAWVEQAGCEGVFRIDGETRELPFHADTRDETPLLMPIWAAAAAAPFGPSDSDAVKGTFAVSGFMGTVHLPVTWTLDEKGKRLKTSPSFFATLRGVYHFDLYRAELVSQLPLQRGTEWHGHHLAFWIRQADVESYRMSLKITADGFRIPGAAYGIFFSPATKELGVEYRLLAINEPAKTLISPDSYMGQPTSNLLQQRHYFTDEWNFMGERYTIGEPAPKTSVPALLALDYRPSRLGVFRRVKIGSVAVPFEYKDYHFDPLMNSPEWR